MPTCPFDVVANWAVIEIMTYNANYKGLVIYAEKLNAPYLTDLNKRQI
jgi:hypothetical protein